MYKHMTRNAKMVSAIKQDNAPMHEASGLLARSEDEDRNQGHHERRKAY